jgi:hypothetical protein
MIRPEAIRKPNAHYGTFGRRSEPGQPGFARKLASAQKPACQNRSARKLGTMRPAVVGEIAVILPRDLRPINGVSRLLNRAHHAESCPAADQRGMLMASKLVHGASWLAAVLAAVFTSWCVHIVGGGNYCWDAFAFGMMASLVCGGTFLLGVIPSAILCFRGARRRDWISLSLAGSSLLIVLAEAIWLNVIPQRGE